MSQATFKNRKSKKHCITNSNDPRLPDALLQAALEPYAIRVSPELAEAIRRYLALLLLWNRKMNLTSLTDPHEILQRHFGESMFAARALSLQTGCLLDVGAGAGFPGLALKMVCPGLEVRLIEPNCKKTAFLAEVRRALGLSSVGIVRGRFTDVDTRTPIADYVTCRALGGLELLLSWAGRALKANGCLILWSVEQHRRRLSNLHGWTWEKPICVPLSRRRVLLVGRPNRDQ